MKSFKALSCLILLGMSGVGCSQGTNYLQNVDLGISQPANQNDEFINLSVTLNLGSSFLADLSIPVKDPVTQAEIGSLGIQANANGTSTVILSVDTSVLIHSDPTLGQSLPNGGSIPSSLGAPAGELLAIPILTDSRIYVGGDMKSHVYAGVAMSIPEMATVTGSILGSANLFFSKQIGSVLGVAGVYTSSTAAENGVAVFASYAIPTTTSTATATSVQTSVATVATQSASVPLSIAAAPVALRTSAKSAVAPVSAPIEQMHNDGMSTSSMSSLYKFFNGGQKLQIH